jgi:hypothetical protein
VTPEEEHLMSFLQGNKDNNYPKITQEEMREQLFNHMRPQSEPGWIHCKVDRAFLD